MTKEEFKTQLRQRLSGLPQGDIEERISFYEESINDRMEEGMPEEEAVAGIGTMDEIVEQIMSEIPLTRLVRDKVKPKRKFKAWEIVLLVLGSPVWLPLLITGIALIFIFYMVFWVLVLAAYVVELSFILSAIAAVAQVVLFLVGGNPAGALYMGGACLILAGLTIFWFFACAGITKGVMKLTGAILTGIKSSFVGKEN